jgi:hypothetical protein
MKASVQLENKITGRDSQEACRQDELIGMANTLYYASYSYN